MITENMASRKKKKEHHSLSSHESLLYKHKTKISLDQVIYSAVERAWHLKDIFEIMN